MQFLLLIIILMIRIMIIIQIKSYTVMKDGTVANYRKNHLVKWEQYL